MGGQWRMPTEAEFQELIDACDIDSDFIFDEEGSMVGMVCVFSLKTDPSKKLFFEPNELRLWSKTLSKTYFGEPTSIFAKQFYLEHTESQPMILDMARQNAYNIRAVLPLDAVEDEEDVEDTEDSTILESYRSDTYDNQNYTHVGRNLFGFNKGIITGQDTYNPNVALDKSIRGVVYSYNSGYENSTLHRLRWLGFDGIDGWYTASGYIYLEESSPINSMNVRIEICDSNVTSVIVTKTPTYFKTSHNVYRYHTPTTSDGSTVYNGFFDLRYEDGPDVPKVYIRDLKIERGKQATPWCPALEDLQTDFIKPNLINGTSNRWSSWVTPNWDGKKNVSHRIPDNGIPKSYDSSFYIEVEYKDCTPSDNIPSDTVYPFESRIGCYNNKPNHGWYNMRLYKIWWDETAKEGITKITGRFPHPIEYASGLVVCGSYWKTGSFRYRMATLKEGDIPNPIWCPSEMDVANPNLITKVNILINDNTSGSYINTISINDAPNPYITNGWYINSADKINGLYIVETLTKDGYYTQSCYVRAKQPFKLRVGSDQRYGEWTDFTENHNTKYIDVPGDNIWRRYSYTYYYKVLSDHSTNRLPILFYAQNETCSFEICGLKFEEGSEATAWVEGVSTANLLENTNEGLVIKAADQELEEYTFESDLAIPKARAITRDIAQVVELTDAPFEVTKGIQMIATTKDIELNKEIHIDKASTFSLWAKGKGKLSMQMIPEEKEIDGVVYGGYKIGDEFEVTDEWKQYEIHDNNLSDFTINLTAFKGSDIWLCAFKLEEGINATEWVDWEEPVDEEAEVDFMPIENETINNE